MSKDKQGRRSKIENFPFARRMERKAKRIAKQFEDDINGVKPWYSYAELFEGQAVRVFVGLNPGGTNKSEKLDKKHRRSVYREQGYCSWLDEVWEKPGNPDIGDEETHQGRTKRAFQAMFGYDRWEQVLRETPCLNVIPFRTSNSKKIPSGAWEAAQPWFRGVLRRLQPELIICNGSGEKESAWAAINEFLTIKTEAPINTASSGWIKYGKVTSRTMKGTNVVALPHLSKKFFWPDETHFQKLEALTDTRPDMFI